VTGAVMITATGESLQAEDGDGVDAAEIHGMTLILAPVGGGVALGIRIGMTKNSLFPAGGMGAERYTDTPATALRSHLRIMTSRQGD
jgi:hypothetical protein